MDESPLLNVADVVIGSYVNGLGKRIVIWVQGCTIRCKGCFNPTLQPHVIKNLVNPGMFAAEIVKLCQDIAKLLIAANGLLRSKTNCKIVPKALPIC